MSEVSHFRLIDKLIAILLISANKDAIGHAVWRRMRNNNCAVAIALWLKTFMAGLQKPLKSQGHFVGNSGVPKAYLLKRLSNKVNAVFLRKGRIGACRANPSEKGTCKLSINQLLGPWSYWQKARALSASLNNSVYVSNCYTQLWGQKVSLNIKFSPSEWSRIRWWTHCKPTLKSTQTLFQPMVPSCFLLS